MEKEVINIAVAGLGGRGYGTLDYILDFFRNTNVIAVCDVYEDRMEAGVKVCREKRPDVEVKGFLDYKEMVKLEELDAVLICTAWDAHVQIAIAAMNAGKYAGIECGGASSVKECWDLVNTYERTGKWCMFMENCCYSETELTLLRMVKENKFGELVHVEGGYEHDLRDEITNGHINRHYRFDNYANRCGDVYPQHALGPIQKFLNINRGNRMLTLCSMASKACGLHDYIVKEKGEDHEDASVKWTEGDIVQTMIKCAHGETILLTHDTSLPRPYCRGGKVQGTEGIWTEEGNHIFFDAKTKHGADVWHSWENFEDYMKSPDYMHPAWKMFKDSELKGGGHGGMDHLVLAAFFDAVSKDIEPPIDTYDAATMLVVTPLSEESCALGGAPVPIPDFTNGKWIKRGSTPRGKYCLDEVCYEQY